MSSGLRRVPGAGVLLLDAAMQHAFLGKDYTNDWGDFGGILNRGEDVTAGAIREATEETLGMIVAPTLLASSAESLSYGGGRAFAPETIVEVVALGSYTCFVVKEMSVDGTSPVLTADWPRQSSHEVARQRSKRNVEVTAVARFPLAALVRDVRAGCEKATDEHGEQRPLRARARAIIQALSAVQ